MMRRQRFSMVFVSGTILILSAGLAVAEPKDAAAGPVQPWGGAAVQEWANASQAKIISDMSSGTSAFSKMRLKKGCWKVIPYEFVDGPAGNMVFAGPETAAAELVIPLGVEGWHAIFVGLFSTSEVPTLAWLRLDRDRAPVSRGNSRNDHYGNSEEVFFKVAELNASSRLHVNQQSTGFVSACGVTHVKLIPLSHDEVSRLQADRRDLSHRTLAATFDGFSDFYYRSPRTVEAVRSAVEIFRDTDFGTLLLHSPGSDKVSYPSSVGHMKGTGVDDFPRVGDRHFVESIRQLAAKNINPLQCLLEGAHDAGMKVHVGIRPAGWSFFEPYSDYWESPFFQKNRQWRCQDRDGTPVERMSWAVPQVRQHLIELLREQVRMGADGAHVAFNRGYPVALYEPPATELFVKQHGVDPRSLPESDPRIGASWSDIVTTFMRELRAMLDAEGQRRGDGTRLALSVMILGTQQDDLRFGVDLKRLVGEGLVDSVSTELGFGRSSNTVNLDFLGEVCRPKNVPFLPGVNSSPVSFADAAGYYDRGATGVAVWDATLTDVFHWQWLARSGHVEETRWRAENLKGKEPPRSIYRFRRLGEQVRDGRFGPFWGG
ncbi:MAG: hypothetical protein HUU20_20750 [Pirellulales bacterium]|nr:hypothetical protein [Pirellulales bacterium]